jgi:hypothetical protein
VWFLYLMVMCLDPPDIPCSGGADGRGIGSRVIRIRLQFGKNPFLPSRYLWDELLAITGYSCLKAELTA